MNRRLKSWLTGIISAAISGAAGSIGPMVAAPNEFNFGLGLNKLMAVAAISSLIGVANFLVKSPLPGKKVKND